MLPTRWLYVAAAATLAVSSLSATSAAPAPHAVEHVAVTSHDGITLDGWLIRPTNVPADRKLPIVLWSSPYIGQNGIPAGDDPELYDSSNTDEAVPINVLLAHGYAVAVFNVRGTGNSGGCFTWWGKAEQKDQALLVEWLAARSWSNGNVGMMGLSYHGTTPWEAAIQNPPHLRTIVTAGIVSDPYLFSHTPQGATFTTAATSFFNAEVLAPYSLAPPTSGTERHVPVVPERACPDVAAYVTEDAKGANAGLRSEAFWDERRLIDRFPQVRTSVLLVDGFQDSYLSGHQLQANEVWNLLPNAPKQMLIGQWPHSFPDHNSWNPKWVMTDWNTQLLAWLDYWLKGIGKGPGKDLVRYQEGRYEDQGPTVLTSTLPAPAPPFRTATAWPPPTSRNEVLFLAEGGLKAKATGPSASFLSHPRADAFGQPEALLCLPSTPDAAQPLATFLSEPMRKPVRVAGNPFAYLRLSSSMTGGMVSVNVLDVAPDFGCGPPTAYSWEAHGVKWWGEGWADLRFHQGDLTGKDFPVNAPTHVRIDLTDLAERLLPGHRLAVVVSGGDLTRLGQSEYNPRITVHADGGNAASHLVMPVAEGTFGGRAPTVRYPRRPFLPSLPK